MKLTIYCSIVAGLLFFALPTKAMLQRPTHPVEIAIQKGTRYLASCTSASVKKAIVYPCLGIMGTALIFSFGTAGYLKYVKGMKISTPYSVLIAEVMFYGMIAGKYNIVSERYAHHLIGIPDDNKRRAITLATAFYDGLQASRTHNTWNSMQTKFDDIMKWVNNPESFPANI